MIEPKSRGVLDRPVKPDDDNSLWKSDLSAVAQRAKAEATKQSILSFPRDGWLRGACHRARVRATRWLAMTVLAV
jgi:hypothetical protein